MAIDEAIFRQAGRSVVPPTLRFYGWRSPSVSLGHFQRMDDEIDMALCQKQGIDAVYRPTGGKAVYHDDDLTYAVIAGDRDGFPSDILGTYHLIGLCLAAGLRSVGIRAEIATQGRENDPGHLRASCFSVPSRFELLVDGRKICGSAQVRSRGIFLQHGSLLLTFDPVRTYDVILPHAEPREEQIARLRGSVTSVRDHQPMPGDDRLGQICRALQGAFADRLGAVFREAGLSPEEEELKENLLRTKYRRDVRRPGEKGLKKWT